MGNNNLYKVENTLRSIAKRYKNIKYSLGLAILFLMMGVGAFSEEIANPQVNVAPTREEIATSRENLKNSVGSLQSKIDQARSENSKSLAGLRLELMQLMEQGDQVVKSPWMSWQFGANYMYNKWNGTYKGRGDKAEKYIFNGIYTRGNWKVRNAMNVAASNGPTGGPITPGNENTSSWKNLNSGSSGGVTIEKDSSISSGTNGNRSWGLVDLRNLQEPTNEVELLAHISPKEVTKNKVDLNVVVSAPTTISAPVVNPQVNTPVPPPTVELPEKPNLAIPGEPTLTVNPTINLLTINKVGAITVSPAAVNPVDFMLSPKGLSGDSTRNFQPGPNNTYNLNGHNINVNTANNYISTWNRVKGLDGVSTNVEVTAEDTRAFMIDEGIDSNDSEIKPFKYTGTITLKKSKNVGMDVQGSHTDYTDGTNPGMRDITKVANIRVTNDGKIIGVGAPNVKNQVAFGFNNFDASSNNTRTEMINGGNGKITLGAPESAGIQLRPEDPWAKYNSPRKGLNMMTGENGGTVTLNGYGSFGILTVKNRDLDKYKLDPNSKDLAKDRDYSDPTANYKVIVAKGGQIASRAQEEYMSKIENTSSGKINVQSDDSVGVGILNTIQSVKINGEVNIGTEDPSSLPYSNKSGGTSGKVEGSTGVYTQVATRPVRGREYARGPYGEQLFEADGKAKVNQGYYDDHGLENVTSTSTSYTYTDSDGKSKTVTNYTGVTIGTETVEVGGTVTLGDYAENSYGLRNNTSQVEFTDTSKNYKTSGSITLTGNGKVYVKGKKNFGAVAEGDNYYREIKKAADQYPERVPDVGRIDIAGLIEVTGQQSIGYVLKSGQGTNSGTIKVTGHSGNNAGASYEGSLGFYGVKGTFTNTGTIEASGKIAHAVVAKTSNMTFNHYGTIKVSSPNTDKGNIAVYSDGFSKVNFYNNSKVYVGDYSVGIHSADKAKFNNTFKNLGTLNIKIGKESTFAYLDGDATTTLKEFFGNSKVNLEEEMGQSSSVVYASNEAKANLDTDYTITKGSNASTIALLASNKATVSVESGKTLTTNTNVALAAVDGTSTAGSGSTAQNNGTILSTRTNGGGIGIYSKDNGSKGINAGTITMQGKNAVGMYGKNVTTLENQANKVIETQKEESVGMYGEVDGAGTNKFTVKNAGTINIGEKKSAGIYVKNASTGSNLEDNLKVENNGEINLNNGEELIGIYAPKSTVSKVGKISLADSVTKSVATYISDGAKIADTSTAEINLGTSGKNIAYYVKNKDTSLGAATHLGKITGYGVGVYLEGKNSTDTAKLDSTSPALNFKQGGATGDGIIGLYLKGSTDISGYNKDITVGDTVSGKYAMGIYAEGQGTSANKYKINTNITSGKKSVGIFADKDSSNNKSYIEYKGIMNLGEGATGFYVDGEMQLDKNTAGAATINLAGGVVAYVTENSKFYGGKAVVNLTKSGIGVYGKKGSTVNVGNWTFNNNGNEAEEIRLEEGQAPINPTSGNKNLKPKMVLSHVINGETYLESGKTVTSVNDGTIKAEQNIGLMAQGIKNKIVTGITWKEADYEIENYGTIDFSAAKRSTAIYSESARAKNDGTIKVGENSTGIYGIYKDNTRKFDGSGPGAKNKLEITTTTNSKINLGNNSTGMYLVNAQKLDNLGGEIKSTTGATKNVGIYALNGATSDVAYNKNENYNILTMNNKANITLGDGSVGIFSRGKGIAPAERNTVTNTGDITVGKNLTDAPAVAMYAENTKLDTNSNVTVGENGIAFYGKHSEITAKGTANFQNKGVLAYLENSKFTSYLGNLNATQNTMMYLKNSIANLAGNGTKVDMTVADNFTGAYIEGNSTLTGVKTVELGKNSSGLFLKNANFTSDIEKITSTKEGAKGLLAIESNLTNNSKINLSGDGSIGIYSNATGKTVTNNGELTISGKKTLGVFLKGSQTFVNTANINVADTTSTRDDEKTIGIYTSEGTSNIKHNSGIIEVGHKSIGIYSTTNSAVEMNGGKIHVKDQGIGIYKKDGTLVVKGELDIDAHTTTDKNSEPAGVYAEDGANITDSASKITVGAKSYGFILNNEDTVKENVYNSTNTGTVSLGNDSVFLYSSGKAKINNGRNISSNADRLIAFYIKGTNKGKGDFTNNATIDFSNTKGSIGIYAPNGKATNKGRVLVGRTDDIDPATGKVYTDVSKIVYGIGMAADNGGHIINDGEIRVYGNKSIGMYGKGVGTIVENTANGKIYLDGSRATATDKIQSMTGVYVDDGATFINRGNIRTTEAYAGKNGKVNDNVSGLVGVAVMNGSTLENYGNIEIDADNSYGVIIRGKKDANGNVERYAVIKNYGNIRVRGRGTYGISWKDVKEADIKALEDQINSKLTSDPNGQELRGAGGTDKDYEGVKITVKDGKPTFSRGGKPVPDSEVEKIEKIIGGAKSNLGISDVGFYIDTLGRTKPIDIDGAIAPINSQLIVGTEYSELTNKKEWFVKEDVLKPFLQQIQGRNFKLTSLAGSLTWLATPVLDNNGQIQGIAMTKLPYTSFVKKTDNAWNFADGLEQRYGMNALDSREKKLFNLLNGIGKNEQAILVQAFDEMMGHQYANTQQRINATGNILDKEFSYLKDEWHNPTKDSNKIKTFGTKGEYKTDTAGVIDYKYNAYGVAYVHENEDIKLGKGRGWYTGIVHNTFKFKDIGNSKEQMLQAKVGLFKSVPFDDNNSLNWTISGDIFVGHNKMHRKFLVVNEIFNAKSKYYTYGIGIKNELSKEFRLSEDFSIRAYGALKLEYGRVSKIKEKTGEVKLEVKQNDYISMKPEIGTELAYRHYFGTKTLRTSIGIAYENELGKLANGKNKARVADTTANYFNIRGEKEDRKGNVKVDLNVGLDNTRVGVTANVGYDTKGENLRGGLGLRVIF